MKVSINNKRYDTETAQKVATWEENLPGDLLWVCETLYRKRTGEFFLHGEGGAKTCYAASARGGWSKPGEKIVPLTYAAAQNWGETHLDADQYDSVFGKLEDVDTLVVTTISLPETTRERAKRIAAQRNISMSELITQLIDALG